MKGLKTRAISAVVFVAVMIGGIYGGKELLTILLLIITALCLSEFFNLVLDKSEKGFLIRKTVGVSLGIIPLLAPLSTFWGGQIHINWAALFYAFPLIPLFLLFELFQKSKDPFANIGNILGGFFYVSLPIWLIWYVDVGIFQYAPNIIMGILLLIWSNDTFAYLVGSKIGKNKLFPRISPGKTWEGTIGGGICALGISFIIAYLFNDLTQMQWLIVAAICVVFGTLGDLVESMLKRSKGVKDSGNLMPGHGGALDRFDAFLFVLPFVSFYLMMI